MLVKKVLIGILFLPLGLFAQCVVENGTDYKITAEFYPTEMLPESGCTTGPGNFRAQVAYDINLEGPNIPTNPIFFYQLRLTCGTTVLASSGNLNRPVDGKVSGVYTTAQNYFSNGDCATSTPQSLDCIGPRKVQFIGLTSNFRFFNIRCDALENRADVKFEKLNALLSNAQYVIDWKIAPSEEVVYFLVEKGLDDRRFETLSSKLEYQKDQSFRFVDNSKELTDREHFYRIKTVQSDGRFAYSPVFGTGEF